MTIPRSPSPWMNYFTWSKNLENRLSATKSEPQPQTAYNQDSQCMINKKRPGFLCIVLLFLVADFYCYGNNKAIAKWHKKELTFVSHKSYSNPVYEVDFFGVEFFSPSGERFVSRGFWDGENTWKVRFMPNQTGKWRFTTICSDDSNLSLNQIEGSFQCTRNRSTHDIYQRGALLHPAGSYHLEHDDGKPFLYIGCTAWNGGLYSTPEEWDLYLSNRKKHGYSVIQLVTTQWRGALHNAENETAFTGTERIMVNRSFFKRMDERIDRINAYGLVAAPVMLWAWGGMSPGVSLPERAAIKLAEYILARYDANHVIWNLGGDGHYLDEHEKRWKKIGREVFGKNNHQRLVTLHPRGLSWYGSAYNDEKWLNIISYQTGHANSQTVIRWKTQGPVATTWMNLSPRPIIYTEPVYENGNNADEVRKSAYWSIFAAPVAGVSYGSHTLWPWLRKGDKPINHGEKEPSSITWYDALFHEGSIQIGYLASFFRNIDWWKLFPANHLLKEQPGLLNHARWQSVLASDNKAFILVYLSVQEAVKLNLPQTKSYGAKWFDTTNNKFLKASPEQHSDVLEYHSPVESDAILMLFKKN